MTHGQDSTFFFQLLLPESPASGIESRDPEVLKTEFSVEYRMIKEGKEDDNDDGGAAKDEEYSVFKFSQEIRNYRVGRELSLCCSTY